MSFSLSLGPTKVKARWRRRPTKRGVTHVSAENADDALLQARAKALASTVRLRILRICLHEAHTNREIATALGMNPGSCLHHVRTLVDTGYLRAEESRRGVRGSREVPYRATRLSWTSHVPVPGISTTMIETFLQEIQGLAPDDIDVARLGLRLDEDGKRELFDRFDALLQAFAARPADPDGSRLSIMLAIHPEVTPPAA